VAISVFILDFASVARVAVGNSLRTADGAIGHYPNRAPFAGSGCASFPVGLVSLMVVLVPRERSRNGGEVAARWTTNTL
jgi:hypothetical protein